MADALRAAISSVTTTVFPRSRLIQDNPRYRMIGTGLRIIIARNFHGCLLFKHFVLYLVVPYLNFSRE